MSYGSYRKAGEKKRLPHYGKGSRWNKDEKSFAVPGSIDAAGSREQIIN